MKKIKEIIEKYMLYINLILVITGMAGLVLFINELNKNQSTQTISYVTNNEINSQNTEQVEPQFIDIEGQVKKPGVYEIKRGETIRDIVVRADGFSTLADMRYVQLCINLAEKVKDQQKIYVPAKVENLSCNTKGFVSGDSSNSSKVSLNNSSQEELESLPGIGESTAKKIIEARPYAKIEDLMDVSGIGDATFEKLRDYIEL